MQSIDKFAGGPEARHRTPASPERRTDRVVINDGALAGVLGRYDARQHLVRAWFATLLSAAVIFTAVPSIDISVSSLFYHDTGFLGTRSSLLEGVRQIIWTLAVAVGIAALFGSLVAIMRYRFLGSTYHLWNIVVGVYILGPGVMANLLLKSYWGRARPAQVEEFGGTADFTPALWPSDECARNCSFVSGEASGATAVAVAIWLLSAPIPLPWLRRACRAFAVTIAVVGSALRVAAGRHFLSDVIFAVLLVTGIALFLLRYQASPAAEVEDATD